MGLFKKKAKPSGFEAFNEAGFETGFESVKLTRKELKGKLFTEQEIRDRTQKLLEKLKNLRMTMYRSEKFVKNGDRIEKFIYKLKTNDTDNKAYVLEVIDGFISTTCKECANYVNRGNEFAVRICLDSIEEFVDDRAFGGMYYENENFKNLMIDKMKFRILEENTYSKKKNAQLSGDELASKYKDPEYARERRKIASDVERINEDIDNYNIELETIGKKIRIINEAISAIKRFAIHNDVIDSDRYSIIVDTAIEAANANLTSDKIDEKIKDKIMGLNRKPTDSSLRVKEHDVNAGTYDDSDLPDSLHIHD